MRSSKEPARARAAQALTSAPIGPWSQAVGQVGADSGGDPGAQAPAGQWWHGVVAAAGVEDEHAGRQDQPVDGEGRRQMRGICRRDRQCRIRRMEHVRQLHRIVAFQRDEVLDAHVHRIADPDMVAAAVLAVGDTRLLHADHFADKRPEHRGRPAELPGQHCPKPLGLTVGRRIIQVDAHPPVALAHHRRRVQEQGETQAADVETNNLARHHVIGQKCPAPVQRCLPSAPTKSTGRPHRMSLTRNTSHQAARP